MDAIDALRRGKSVILPTDTVYGLCCAASSEQAVRAMYRLKGRGETQPTAALAASVEALLDVVPELRGEAEAIARALLPGPFTLVLPNPERRLPWLAGERPETIGVRVPELPPAAARIVGAVGAVAATSANLPGEPPPRRVDQLPPGLRAGVAAVVDGGELPGAASTVLDCTAEPKVLREGAVPAAEALERVRGALA
jgi:L-threonylcarbamoyladenylate synthase